MHVAVHVADTDAALARVEAAGGTRMWPEVIARGSRRVIYVHDPDGNVLELIDRDMRETVEAAARTGAV